MTSMSVAFSALQPLLMASHTICILTACLSSHYPGLPDLFLPLSSSLVCPCMTTIFMVMHIVGIPSSLSHGCAWIANLL